MKNEYDAITTTQSSKDDRVISGQSGQHFCGGHSPTVEVSLRISDDGRSISSEVSPGFTLPGG
jgi:hypothetical protein